MHYFEKGKKTVPDKFKKKEKHCGKNEKANTNVQLSLLQMGVKALRTLLPGIFKAVFCY